MADTLIDLYTGRFAPKQISGQVFANCSGFGSLRTAQVDQPSAELTRAGRRFTFAVDSSVTGIAPVQAVPSTAAQWAIFNNSTTNTYTFDSLGTYLVSGTAGAGIVVLAAFFQTPAETAGTAHTSAQSLSASQNMSSSAVLKASVTITAPATPVWFVVAKDDSANTAVGSVAAIGDLSGRLMLPPQWGLGLAVVSPTGTTPLFVPHAIWTEAAQDLE